jgi:hypothetical protein
MAARPEPVPADGRISDVIADVPGPMVYKWPPSTPTRLGGSCDLAAAGTVPVKWVSSALLAAATTNALVPGKSLLRLASFGRLILTDLLGTGSSDAVLIHDCPAMQAWTDGLVAVLDAVGSECVSVFAIGVGTSRHVADRQRPDRFTICAGAWESLGWTWWPSFSPWPLGGPPHAALAGPGR